MIIGITGGIGSGKSTVLKMFGDLGISTIDADDIGKTIINNESKIKQSILAKFPYCRDDLHQDIDRKKLRAIIFDSDENRTWLEQLLHPIIKDKIRQFAKDSTSPYCIVEIPLLFEARWQDCVDRILIIDLPEELQKSRTSARDHVPYQAIEKIMATQFNRVQRLANEADIISNEQDINNLKNAVLNLHHQYLKLAQQLNKE